MLSLRPHHLAFLFLFNCLFLVNAVPVLPRQDGQATTVMTQSTTNTAGGAMTQTCVISLTPITDDNGNAAVREVKTCTLTMGASNSNGSGSNSSGSGSNSSDTSSSTSTDSSNSGSTSTDSSGASSTSTAGGTDGVSSAAASATTTDSAGAAASSSSDSGNSGGGGGAAVSAGAVSSVANTAANNGATPAAGTAAAEQQAASPSTSAAFAVPGQKIQVLPIGLGVFAGISVIALIVVGLVTYERTKYRKAFRARKLAESGAGMGYGGMAQR